MAEERPILTGFMVLDGWADDYSDWDGTITGPANPKGANLYWHDPIPMIERRAFDDVVRDRDFSRQQWRDWSDKANELEKTIETQDASASREIDRLQGNWEAAEKEVQALKLENARLREALEFYAELSNYQSQQYTVTPNNPKISPWFFESTPVVQDDGNRARVALEEK